MDAYIAHRTQTAKTTLSCDAARPAHKQLAEDRVAASTATALAWSEQQRMDIKLTGQVGLQRGRATVRITHYLRIKLLCPAVVLPFLSPRICPGWPPQDPAACRWLCSLPGISPQSMWLRL